MSVILVPTENTAGPMPQQPLSSRHRRIPLLHLPSRSRGAGGKGGSLEEITNQIFDDLMKGKSELAHAFDELGVVDLERGGKVKKGPAAWLPSFLSTTRLAFLSSVAKKTENSLLVYCTM